MTQSTYDVAVIGAGPSGVMAAWKAADSGARTVLLEKEQNPGKKVCAEGILEDTLPDVGVSPAKEFVVNEIQGAYLYPPDEARKVDVGGRGYILDKPAFLDSISQRAQSSGAEISYGTHVHNITKEDGHVSLEAVSNGASFTITSDLVIGCDGVGSLLARRFFPRKNFQAIAALQYSMSNCNLEDESRLEIYVGHQIAPSGYVWVFPKGRGAANVGIGMKGSNARLRLDTFIARHPRVFSDAKIEKSLAAPVPVGGEVERYVEDNLMLCGDAAGQVIPLTGAGIHTSLVAGKLAGQAAGEAVRSRDFSAGSLSRYKAMFESMFGQRISNSLKALESFERLSDEDLNIIAEYLKGQDIVDVANGFNPTRAVGLLVKHPVLAIKMAYQLLTS